MTTRSLRAGIAIAASVVVAACATGGDAPPDTTAVAVPPAPTSPFDTARFTRSGASAPPVAILDAAGATEDSLWFSFREGVVPGVEVTYASPPVVECGSGAPVTVAGTAILLVRLSPTDAHVFDGEQATATITDRVRMLAGPNVVQMNMICDFEAHVEWAVGLGHVTGFRVREPDASGRLVIDLEHR